MNNSTFTQAQNAYDNKDYTRALELYNDCVQDSTFPLSAGEFGTVYHQIGNCYVKLGNYAEAISAYASAVSDQAYGSAGTVYYNLGMAYAYMNDFGNAIANFQNAVNNQGYRTKYKAYTAMGNALMKSGKPAEAGAVFRKAALDNTNPDPTRALLNLGVCFMALGRSADAVTVYESAFQFQSTPEITNRLNANLGQAYVANGQMQKAVVAFENALRDKTYVLSDSASVDYQKAIAAVSKGTTEIDTQAEGNAAAAAAGMAVGAVAVTDEAEKAEAKPDDSQMSGFDTINNGATQENEPVVSPQTEEDKSFEQWTQSTQQAAYNPEQKKSPGKVVLIVLLVMLLVAIAGGVVLYCLGFGLPTQEMVTKQFFDNPADAKEQVFAQSVSDSKKNCYAAMVSSDSSADIKGVDRNITESTVYVDAKTSTGGTVTYKIKMNRDIISWKIASVDLAFANNSE
ncbi:MAG: tetratricopeptide repeat protein [Coriobacteriia bacterium]|nr:tetratricopeptide repeat protein [Coriobacteriia bacterium]